MTYRLEKSWGLVPEVELKSEIKKGFSRNGGRRGALSMRRIMDIVHTDRGQALILVALALTLLLGFTALVVDGGSLYYTKARLQNAADAGALAGAYHIGSGNPKQKAKDYAVKNGMVEAEVTATTPYVDSKGISHSDQIEVVCTRNVKYSLARVLGFPSGNVSARAVAQKTGTLGGVFNYALFASESKIDVNSAKHIITGDVYGRNGIHFGNKSEITGNADYYTGEVSCQVKGDVRKLTSPLETPDLWQLVQDKDLSYTEVTSQADFDALVAGGLDNAIIYANFKNPKIQSGIEGTGIIMVDGDLEFSGGGHLKWPQDDVMFYSRNGDITFNGGIKSPYSGILYAPHGTITFNGKSVVIKGRIIAEQVIFNGASSGVDSSGVSNESLNLLGTTLKLVE